MMNKRHTLKKLGGLSLLVAWQTPMVNSIALPAHAQTSGDTFGCSDFLTESVDEPISITVSGTTVNGPVAAQLDGTEFATELDLNSGSCSSNTQSLDQQTEFAGSLNSQSNTISGVFNVRQFCAGVLVCEQLTEFTVELQSGTALDGSYTGRATGTLRCCPEFSS